MGLTHEEIVHRWKRGERGQGFSMFTDGTTIFSWGKHFPIATKVKGLIFFNTDDYSASTRKHKCYTRRAYDNVIEVDTDQIIDIVENPEKPIVIIKEIMPKELDKIIEGVRSFCKEKGVKRFPTKKYTRQIQEMVVLAKL